MSAIRVSPGRASVQTSFQRRANSHSAVASTIGPCAPCSVDQFSDATPNIVGSTSASTPMTSGQ
jgi:hypothetical protein